MRKIARSAFAILISSAVMMGQDAIPVPAERPMKKESREIYGIPGSHLLQQDWQRIGPILNKAVKESGLTLEQLALRKQVAWNFTVGSARNWWATDLTTYTEYAVPSTCRAVGTNCYIFVEDALWNSRVSQQTVDAIRTAFDSSTPANASKGIYQLDTEYYGNPPDFDSDPKIVLLILDIKDGFSGSGGYTAGYFYSINQYTEALVQSQLGSSRHSNEAEIYYLDANPADLTTTSGFVEGASTTAHEFQHMIHFNYDQDEISFVNEGMSESASALCGYSLRSPALYYANTDINFLSWNATGNVLADYSRTAIFAWYLIEQFGSSLTKQIVSRLSNGVTGYNESFAALGSNLQYSDIIRQFAIATFVNDTAVDSRYGFRYGVSGVPTIHRTHATTVVATTTDTLRPSGTRYIQYTGGDSLRFLITSGASIAVQAILEGPSGTTVETVTPSLPYIPSGFGTTYVKATFAITNLSTSVQAAYTYSSSGSGGVALTTLNYAGSAVYYLPLPSTNQKLAVRFTPSTTGTLRSAAAALNSPNGVLGSGVLRVAVTQNASGSIGGIPGTQIGTAVDVPFAELTSGLFNEIDLSTAGVSVTAGVDFHVTFEVIGTVGDTLQFLLDDGTPTPTTRSSSYRIGVNGLNWYNRADPNYASGRTPDSYNLLVVATVASPIVVAPPQAIYPGDANDDGLVDVRDVLPIGQYFGTIGPVRTGGSLTWQAQDLVDPWAPTAAAFADCDGNGTVAAADVQGILTNWGRTRAGIAPPAIDPKMVCEDLLAAIDASGSSSEATRAIRAEIQQYMQTTLGVSFDYALDQNWPNPFNPSTTIRFSVPENVSNASLTIVNLLGQTVWQKEFSTLQAGRHSVVWNGETVSGGRAASGVYLYKMSAGPYLSVKRMTLLK